MAAVAQTSSRTDLFVVGKRWTDETTRQGLPELIRESLDELRALTAPPGGQPPLTVSNA